MLDMPVLSVKSLCVSFGNHHAVRDLSFDIHAGETLALVGESGSGKSATALSVLRLIEREGGDITRGQIRLGSENPVDLARLTDREMQAYRGNRISMIFQEPMNSQHNGHWRTHEGRIESFVRGALLEAG